MTDDPFFVIGTGLFLALVAHHLTIGRDRRREFNEIAIPLRGKIRREAERPSPTRLAITRDEADAIMVRIWWFRRRRFMEDCESYWRCHGQQHQNELGEAIHDEVEEVSAAARELLRYVKPH